MNKVVMALGVFFITLLIYLPTVRYEFLTCDDHEYVYQNPNVMTGISGENIIWAVKSCGYSSNWHPLTWISLQLDASLIEASPNMKCDYSEPCLKRLSSVMHAHNVVVHAANAALLFLLIVLMRKRFTPENAFYVPLAALFALLWAIHPLRTEVVCWVSERKELVSVFFMLLTMLSYIARGNRPSGYVISLLLFALALAAKPVAVSLPIVLFTWDWTMADKPFRRSFAAVVPFVFLACGASALTLAAQVDAVEVGSHYSFWEKVVMALSSPVIYLRQTLCPMGLSAFYPARPPVPWIELAFGVALLAGSIAVGLLWILRRRSFAVSLLALAVAWYHVSLVPMLGIVKVGDQPHSDRYTYWVGCGLAAVAALAIGRYVRRREGEVLEMLAVGVVALAVATWSRMSVWKDSVALYSDSVPKSWAEKPVCSLARLLCERGEEGVCQADAVLRKALMSQPTLAIRAEYARLIAVRTQKSPLCFGEHDPVFGEARYEAGAVLAEAPSHSIANEAMAIVEMKEGKWEKALMRFELALKTCEKPSDRAESIGKFIALCREHAAAKEVEPNVQK